MIYFDDSIIKVGGIMLPGLMKSIEIQGDAKVEEQQMEGSSSKPKQATGFEDAKIIIELALNDSTKQSKEDKLKVIQNLFKKTGQSLPRVFDIVNQHTSIRNINRVIFKKLTSKETSKNDELSVSIEFWEYLATTIKASSGKTTSSSSSKMNLTPEYSAYLASSRGLAPQLKSKITKSPANKVEAANILAMNKLTTMPF